jgi:hypothetical protein
MLRGILIIGIFIFWLRAVTLISYQVSLEGWLEVHTSFKKIWLRGLRRKGISMEACRLIPEEVNYLFETDSLFSLKLVNWKVHSCQSPRGEECYY